jgi:putative endonuclease
MMRPKPPWFLYLIRCNDNSLYAGITVDLVRRFAEHEEQGKKCAKYLKGKAPLTLVFTSPAGATKAEASRLEFQVKRLSKGRKERLASGTVSLAELGLLPDETSLTP